MRGNLMSLGVITSFLAIVAMSFEQTWTAVVVGGVAASLITHGL